MEEKNDEIKHEKIEFVVKAGHPLQVTGTGQDLPSNLTNEQLTLIKAVGSTIATYVKAAQQLLDDKYSNIRNYAPIHLRDVVTVNTFFCKDGIIIRYEKETENQENRFFIGGSDETIFQLAPKLSENVVYCHVTGIEKIHNFWA